MKTPKQDVAKTNQDSFERAFRIVDLAKMQYHVDGECEIEDTADVSESDGNGAYVQAWVWVSFDGTEFDREVCQKQ